MEPEESLPLAPAAVGDAPAAGESQATARAILPRPASGNLLPPFVSPVALMRSAAGALIASTLVAWVAVGVDIAEVRQYRVQLQGTVVDRAEVSALALTSDIVGIVQLALFVVTALLFLAWLYRMRVNARALGVRKLVYARIWALLGFVIPVLNFVRPYQVMAEIWRASDPRVLDPFDWKNLEPPRILSLFWGAFVIAATLELLAYGLGLSAGVVPFKSLVASAARAIADTAAAIGASFGFFCVTQLTRTQLAKRARQRVMGAPG